MKNNLLFEAVADIAYLAGVHNYYSGNSRADMQKFIFLAKEFEKKYKGIDWEDTNLDYMTEIETFAKEQLKLKTKLILNYPHAFDAQWDNIEIAKCRDDGENTYQVDDDSDEPGDFYSLYAHQAEGHVMCIADVPTEKDAIALRDTLVRAVKMFKDNGYMKMYDSENLQKAINKLIDSNMKNLNKNNIYYSQNKFFKTAINDLFI